MQRSDAEAKEQWWAYCDLQGGGVRDPAKHDPEFLQYFITQYQAGHRWEQGPKTHGHNLSDLFKEGQRKSQHWKTTWAQYCQHYGGGVNDPAKHETSFLVGFMDLLGQRGNMALQMMSPMMGMGMVPMPGSMSSERPLKRMRIGGGSMYSGSGYGGAQHSSGDPIKDQLVAQVKSYQRSGEEQKHQWWNFCDLQLGGVRDPMRHDGATLQNFLSLHGVE